MPSIDQHPREDPPTQPGFCTTSFPLNRLSAAVLHKEMASLQREAKALDCNVVL